MKLEALLHANRQSRAALGIAFVMAWPTLCAAQDNDHVRQRALAPGATSVASTERVVGADELLDVASRALERALQGRADRFVFGKPARGWPSTVIDALGAELVAREVAAPYNLSSRMTVWVDVKQAGQVRRTLLVPVQVEAYRMGWVPLRDLAPGTRLSADILREQEVDVAAGGHEPWRGEPEGLVLRTAVLSGHYLAAGQVAAPAAVSRGEPVRIVHRMGAVEVQATATALQDGEVGKNIQVRISANQSPVMARVTAAGQVELMK